MKKKILPVLALLLLLTACSGGKTETASSGSGETSVPSSTQKAQETAAAPAEAAAPAAQSTGSAEIDALSSSEVMLRVEGDSYPLTVYDALGNETVLEKKPERIAVMSGTLLNIWYDLGGESVCTSDISSNLKILSERKDEMMAIPSAGAVYQVNLEAIIATHPDLIITQTGVQTSAAAKLKQMGYMVIETNAKTVQSLAQVYEGFGKLLGAQEKAKERIDAFRAGIADIQSKIPSEKPSCVILYVTSSTVSVKLDQSIAGDIAYMIGMENIASGLPADTLGSENTPLDIEYIVVKNPDYVLVTSMVSDNDTAMKMVKDMFANNPAWSTVKAIKSDRVVYLPQQYYLYNAGPYYLDAVRYMACSVYPDIFGGAKLEID